MKKNYLKLVGAITFSLLSVSTFAQQPWRVGGNSAAQLGGALQPRLGTNINRPLLFETNGIPRKKLNANLSYAVNSYGGNRNGFMLLGYSQTYAANLFNNASKGAFSLLHLNGSKGTFIQEGGYRNWMRTGITFTDNNDLSYMGIRKVGNGTDKTETVIAWSDNSGNGFPKPF